tara:strand:- start:137 stop:271 length:135 start_codon:yes stop_codon:yes gene_type:complete
MGKTSLKKLNPKRMEKPRKQKARGWKDLLKKARGDQASEDGKTS